MKKLFKLFALTAVIMLCILSISALAEGTGVYIDGVAVKFDNSTGYPFVSGGRTLVPLRVTMESFGASVDWEADTSTAIVRKDTTTVRCKINENCIYRNNVKIENDAAAVIVGGRTYLPIRAVLEAFGAEVGWDGSVKVTSPGNGTLIYSIENTPSSTRNYWPVWNKALELKKSGDYTGCINTIKSISQVFLSENQNASGAMLYKHMGECYSNLKEYSNASACFKREAYYWSITPGMEQSRIDAERRSNLIKTTTQLYVKTTDNSMGARTYFGVKHEPEGGTILGAYAEGDTGIYNPYNPDMFYMDTLPELVGKDMGAYLLYFTYGSSVSVYDSHIKRAAEKNKIIQFHLQPLNGLASVNGTDGYLIKLAKEMEERSKTCKLMLRFAGEMNDVTSKWYSEDPKVFIEKFRTVADIFHKYAPSVPVIWAPNFYPADTMDDYYPGDKYVDYVGISSYKSHSPVTDPLRQGVDRGRWSNQLDTIYSLYGHKKPIIVVEGGATYMDYDTGADITPFASRQLEDFYTYLPIKYPNVKMSFMFDRNNDRTRYCLSSNKQYLEAYQRGISSDLFVSDLTKSAYKYEYYEIGNNVKVKAEKTELCCYVTTPDNDTSYVNYYINGTYLATGKGIPYSVNADLTKYKGQKVEVTATAYGSDNNPSSTYTVKINVV